MYSWLVCQNFFVELKLAIAFFVYAKLVERAIAKKIIVFSVYAVRLHTDYLVYGIILTKQIENGYDYMENWYVYPPVYTS